MISSTVPVRSGFLNQEVQVETSINNWASRLASLHAISILVSEAFAYRLKTHLSLPNTAELKIRSYAYLAICKGFFSEPVGVF